MKDVLTYIEERYDSNISDLDVVRNGYIVKCLGGCKSRISEISKILIPTGKKKETHHNSDRSDVARVHKQLKSYAKNFKSQLLFCKIFFR